MTIVTIICLQHS